MRTCNMFDLDMTVDISVDYHYDPYDKIIELTSVKWGDVEILDMISDTVMTRFSNIFPMRTCGELKKRVRLSAVSRKVHH